MSLAEELAEKHWRAIAEKSGVVPSLYCECSEDDFTGAINEAIEHCAQKVDAMTLGDDAWKYRELAAGIRALKSK